MKKLVISGSIMVGTISAFAFKIPDFNSSSVKVARSLGSALLGGWLVYRGIDSGLEIFYENKIHVYGAPNLNDFGGEQILQYKLKRQYGFYQNHIPKQGTLSALCLYMGAKLLASGWANWKQFIDEQEAAEKKSLS